MLLFHSSMCFTEQHTIIMITYQYNIQHTITTNSTFTFSWLSYFQHIQFLDWYQSFDVFDNTTLTAIHHVIYDRQYTNLIYLWYHLQFTAPLCFYHQLFINNMFILLVWYYYRDDTCILFSKTYTDTIWIKYTNLNELKVSRY